jgi:S1-C subfamily serine protease
MCAGPALLHAGSMEPAHSLLQFSGELARAVETGAEFVVAVNGRPHVPSSGILWRPDAVATTDHTLKRDEDVTITLADGRELPATVAGRDAGTDLAVLRLAEPAGPAAKIAPDASIKTGHLVLALGSRGVNGIGASFGIIGAVSGAWRTWRGGQVDRFIRPDVSIYTGFSGGALVDIEGQVIGLNTSGLTRGAGVTVPATTVSRVVEELLAKGRVRRGFIGVGMHPVQLPDGKVGLVILSLEPKGPAAQAGIVIGDVLLTLNGEPVVETDAVQSHLGPEAIGKPMIAGILRGGVPMEITLTPIERPVRESNG